MARITVEDCLKKVPSRFLLVNMVARRVRQIREGSEYLVSSPKNEDIVVSLREIAAGKIDVHLKHALRAAALPAAAEDDLAPEDAQLLEAAAPVDVAEAEEIGAEPEETAASEDGAVEGEEAREPESGSPEDTAPAGTDTAA